MGTELLLGEILDRNAVFLANELKDRGVTLHRKTTIGDNLERLSAAIQTALGRADLVILGGGLGPTDDDLTREAIAATLGETPAENPELLAWLRGLYEARGRAMPELNRKQAWLIPSAEALPNPVGTAPGWFVRTGGKVIVAMPGPPREMNKMWREQAAPRLSFPSTALWHTTLHTSGIGESNVAELLGELTRQANPSVATYARKTGVDVRVAASAENLAAAEQLARPVLDVVSAQLARFTWGRDAETLPEVIGRALGGRRLASVEAVSAGLLAASFADLPNFAGGVASRDHGHLLTLGLTPVTLSEHGLTSEAAALELASGARAHFGAEVGVATVGDAVGGESTRPGQVCVALSMGGLERAVSLDWPGDPDQIRERAVTAALALLARALRADAVNA